MCVYARARETRNAKSLVAMLGQVQLGQQEAREEGQQKKNEKVKKRLKSTLFFVPLITATSSLLVFFREGLLELVGFRGFRQQRD